MDAIVSPDGAGAAATWGALVQRLRDALHSRQASAAQALLLVPYAQLVAPARAAWHAVAGDGPVPRIETLHTWAHALGGEGLPEEAVDGLRLDRAHDLLRARLLLRQAGLGERAPDLAARLVDAAWQVVPAVRAVHPAQRGAWLAQALAGVGEPAGLLVLEAALARIALHWAAASSFATDALWQPGALAGLGVVASLQGPRPDPLPQALSQAHPAAQALSFISLAWPLDGAVAADRLRLHACVDAQDEAQRASACVLAHLAEGRRPVALVAVDRALVRRIGAQLGVRGVALADETGWKLSTTQAAAALMATLRSAQPAVPTDTVLSFLKLAVNTAAARMAPTASAAQEQPPQDAPPGTGPAFPTVAGDLAAALARLETLLRRQGLHQWPQALPKPVAQVLAQPGVAAPSDDAVSQDVATLVARVAELRQNLRAPRSQMTWRRDLAAEIGRWPGLAALAGDDAGAQVLRVLGLEAVPPAGATEPDWARQRMSLAEFTHWCADVLESHSFLPGASARADVWIVAPHQMCARSPAAVVIPGCDEARLVAAPTPDGAWSDSQRRLIGLPDRDALRQQARDEWLSALQAAPADVLWRQSDGGEPCVPSALVRLLMLDSAPATGADARERRRLPLQAVPAALGALGAAHAALMPGHVSASAYGDLRACPYRYFALRLLGLKRHDELDPQADARDFGNWLHEVLSLAHAQGQPLPDDPRAAADWLDQCAHAARERQGLDEAQFLPFAAAWPALRDEYIVWQQARQAEGWRVAAVEQDQRRPLEALQGVLGLQGVPVQAVTLLGRIDRVDAHADGRVSVIDYKTESVQRTRERLKQPQEDTQLAFYAALLGNEVDAQGGYLNLSERDGTRLHPLDGLPQWRDRLLAGLQADLSRVARGEPLAALGRPPDCDYCDARGLCRRDFRDSDAATPTGKGQA